MFILGQAMYRTVAKLYKLFSAPDQNKNQRAYFGPVVLITDYHSKAMPVLVLL